MYMTNSIKTLFFCGSVFLSLFLLNVSFFLYCLSDLFTSHFRETSKSPSIDQSQNSHLKPILQTFSCSGNSNALSKSFRRTDLSPIPNYSQWTNGKTASLDNSIYGLHSRRLCNMTGGWDPSPCIAHKLPALPQIPHKEYLGQKSLQSKTESDYMLQVIDHPQSYQLPQA